MGRRTATTTDPDLLAQVTDRLARVLADQAPRRAQVVPLAVPLPPEETPDPGSAGDVDALDLVDRAAARPFRRVHLGVVCALLLIGLLWAGWALLRARPVAIAAPGSVVSVNTPAPSSPATPSAAPVRLVVHVLGAVRRPGLVTLPDGSRVQDALHAAGGLTRRADPGELNLAQLVTDGEQIVIGTRGSPAGEVRDGGASSSGSSKGGGSSGAALDLNRATQTQLEELPGVGPVTASKIVAWREEHRRFSRVEELQEIDGIGPKTYAQIAPHVRV